MAEILTLEQEAQQFVERMSHKHIEENKRLTAELNALKAKLTRSQQAHARAKPYLELIDQIDRWKEKQLTITIEDKEVAKNILSFAEYYEWDPNTLMTKILANLFAQPYGQTVLGMIIKQLLGKDEVA